MGLPIFYAAPDHIQTEKGFIVLNGEEAMHLSRSLRAKEGDTIQVGDGAGSRYVATISEIGPVRVIARTSSVVKTEPEKPSITLIQALSRSSKMDTAILRAAEAGAASVVPFISPRSDHKAGSGRADRSGRWSKIARESSKVARRSWLLEVEGIKMWPLDPGVLSRQEINLILWEGEEQDLLDDVLPDIAPSSIGAIVGPEGGFSPNEVEELRGMGGVPVSLGDLVLRTESAGSYVAMLIRYHYGLLKPSGS